MNRLTMDVGKVDFHPNRLRFMYAVNIVGAGAIGLALLVAPSAMYSFLGAEFVDSMWAAGYAYSYMLCLGVFCVLGLRSPLKFSSVLLLQASVKILWILAIVVPALMAGPLPSYAVGFCGLFVLTIAGDLIACSLASFLSKVGRHVARESTVDAFATFLFVAINYSLGETCESCRVQR